MPFSHVRTNGMLIRLGGCVKLLIKNDKKLLKFHQFKSYPLHKMTATWQKILSDVFCYIISNEKFAFWLKFYWSLFPLVQLTIPNIGLDYCLEPNRRQAIVWTIVGSTHWRIYAALGGDELKLLLPRHLPNFSSYISWQQNFSGSQCKRSYQLMNRIPGNQQIRLQSYHRQHNYKKLITSIHSILMI